MRRRLRQVAQPEVDCQACFAVERFAGEAREPGIRQAAGAEIDTALVVKALEKIWHDKPETASRTRQRIEAVLDWATVRGYRTGENPARWNGYLQKLLPSRRELLPTEHFAALPYRDVPDLMATLREHSGVRERALEFLILTASRSAEARGARWAEIDTRQGLDDPRRAYEVRQAPQGAVIAASPCHYRTNARRKAKRICVPRSAARIANRTSDAGPAQALGAHDHGSRLQKLVPRLVPRANQLSA